MNSVVPGIFAAVIVLNGFASLRVFRNHQVTLAQRRLQLILIWLLPVVGAVLCLSFLASTHGVDAQQLDRETFTDNVSAHDSTLHAANDGCVPIGADSPDDGGGDSVD